MSDVPNNRITVLKDIEPSDEKDFVLYWMINFRRTSYNFALQRAVEWANKLSKPLLIFEPLILDVGYKGTAPTWKCCHFCT